MATQHRSIFLLAAVACFLLVSVGFPLAQERNGWGAPGPPKMGEVSCQVIDWNHKAKPLPQLTLTCPPEGVYTPIRIYLVLSWAEKENVPEGWSRISKSVKYETKLRSAENGGLEVRLKCLDGRKKERQQEWVRFTYVVRQAILAPNND
jgi:hypothetical protein